MASTDAGVLSFTSTIGQGRRIFNLDNGLKVTQLDITLNNAASAMPVAGVIDLPRTLWTRMGFSRIFDIPSISMANNAGSYLAGSGQWDPVNNSIRLYDMAGGAIAAAAIGNGGKVRCLVFGF
jgi:hypothetical protein